MTNRKNWTIEEAEYLKSYLLSTKDSREEVLKHLSEKFNCSEEQVIKKVYNTNRFDKSVKLPKTSTWSKEHDNIVIEQVKKHPDNLREGFREAEKLIPHSYKAIQVRWYGLLKHKSDITVCFTLVGEDIQTINHKNNARTNKGYSQKKSFIKRISTALYNIIFKR